MSPYNLNKSTIERWQVALDAIVENYGSVIHIDVDTTSHMGAYGMREAIKSAKHFGIEPYCNIEYEFCAGEGPGKVIARPKKASKALGIGVLAPDEFTYPDAKSSFDVVELATTHKAEMMTFPSFADDLDSVAAWAESRGYTISSTKPLTLKKVEG